MHSMYVSILTVRLQYMPNYNKSNRIAQLCWTLLCSISTMLSSCWVGHHWMWVQDCLQLSHVFTGLSLQPGGICPDGWWECSDRRSGVHLSLALQAPEASAVRPPKPLTCLDSGNTYIHRCQIIYTNTLFWVTGDVWHSLSKSCKPLTNLSADGHLWRVLRVRTERVGIMPDCFMLLGPFENYVVVFCRLSILCVIWRTSFAQRLQT